MMEPMKYELEELLYQMEFIWCRRDMPLWWRLRRWRWKSRSGCKV